MDFDQDKYTRLYKCNQEIGPHLNYTPMPRSICLHWLLKISTFLIYEKSQLYLIISRALGLKQSQ